MKQLLAIVFSSVVVFSTLYLTSVATTYAATGSSSFSGLNRESSNNDTILSEAELPEATPIAYESFDGYDLSLYPYLGRNIAFLVDSDSGDAATMNSIVDVFDTAYDYYASATGRSPTLYYEYNGLATVAVAPATCSGLGYGCGYLGATGIELVTNAFNLLYRGVHERNEYDQVLFYELGRNFWFYGDQIEYKGDDGTGAITTGYAVFMRFMAMEATGVTPGPFDGQDFALFKAEVEGLLDRYLADESWNWNNTLRTGNAPPNDFGLGGTDMFASFLFELRARFGDEFVTQLWPAVANRPDATSTQEAVDNFVIASSVAANQNLVGLFADEWRWPVSEAARTEIRESVPLLEIDHSTGAPGSNFILKASHFPRDTPIDIMINNRFIKTLSTNSEGEIRVALDTANLSSGNYIVTFFGNPSFTVNFTLANDAPLHSPPEDTMVLVIPSPADVHWMALPLVMN
jgi:hypothetical protein